MNFKNLKTGRWFWLFVFLLNACSSGTGMETHEAWARSALQGENSTVYLILHNHTQINDSLIGVSSDVANAVELHLSEVTNDVMQMSPVKAIAIAADAEIKFESGGYHIMLINLTQDLKVGDEITVTFHFENYQDLTLTVPVMDSAEAPHTHP